MAYYTASMLTTSTNATQYGTIATFRPGPTQRPVIKQIEIFTVYNNTTAGGIGLAFNNSASLSTGTLTAGGTPRPHEPTETAAGSSLVVAAATAISSITTPATNGPILTFKRFYHAGVGGAGIVWGWPELQGLLTPLSTGNQELLFVNLVAATPAFYGINITFTE